VDKVRDYLSPAPSDTVGCLCFRYSLVRIIAIIIMDVIKFKAI